MALSPSCLMWSWISVRRICWAPWMGLSSLYMLARSSLSSFSTMGLHSEWRKERWSPTMRCSHSPVTFWYELAYRNFLERRFSDSMRWITFSMYWEIEPGEK